MKEASKLRLSFADLEKEIATAPKLAEKFITGEGKRRLEQARYTLAAARSKPNHEFTWEIPRDEAVSTIRSDGEYECKRDSQAQKGVTVIGTLSFSWHMRTGPKPVRDLYVWGNATTQLCIYDSDSTELGMWRMEVGAHDSPGCCFHTQILGREKEPPFPQWLPVPRLPSTPPTPMSCLEFLLSELFQLRWRKHVQRDSEPLKMWRSIQSRRISAFLNWQLKTIEQSTGSPLVDLKTFPDPDVLAAQG